MLYTVLCDYLDFAADLNVELKRGYPVISIPLPTSEEMCEFTLNNTHSVKSFIENIKEEDSGIEEALIHSLNGNRIAQTTSLSSLLTEGFQLKINDKLHTVHPSSEGICTFGFSYKVLINAIL